MKPKHDSDYIEEETDQERRYRRSRKSHFILMMILSFILGALTYRSCIKILISEINVVAGQAFSRFGYLNKM